MLSNQIFYKVLNERTIIIATDNTQKRQQYEEQVIKTFFVSHADATELAQLVNTVILAPQMAIQPRIAANKTANTITVRAAAPVAEIIEQVIKINDKPRAEVIIDVQILEVSRERAKRFGLNLTDYALGVDLLARAGARRRRRRRPAAPGTTAARSSATAPTQRRLAAGVQRQHDLHGHQRCRLLPGGAGRHRAIPRERLADQDRGQAAAARHGGAEGHA